MGKIFDNQQTPQNTVSTNSCYIICPDSSLSPRLDKGALAIIDPDAELTANDICLVLLAEGPILRRYREAKGVIVLDTLKDDVPLVFNSTDENPILFKVMWTFKKV